MIEMFGGTNKNNYNINYKPFEKANIYEDKFDLVFTSPPYYKLEIYNNDKKQSVFKMNDENSWLNKFMYPSLQK